MVRNEQVKLTDVDEQGFYGIRFESIGGFGAHLAGKILAEAGVLYQGLNGAHFSSYGSEKKGSPVVSYVRFCNADQEVRTASPIQEPHLIAVFHEALMKTINVASGLRPGGTIIVNSTKPVSLLREQLGLKGARVAVIDALGIAVEEKTRVNTAMLGAVARVCDFLAAEALKETIRRTFQKKYPQLVESNLRTFDRGYHELQFEEVIQTSNREAAPFVRPAPQYGYLNAPIGGTIINPGNSVLKDLSATRQGFLPGFERDKCVDCAMCEMVCPDLCLVWEDDPDPKARKWRRLVGIDYQYCKGCLKCVEICPTGALWELRESEGYAEEHRVPKFSEMAQTTENPSLVSSNRKVAQA